MGALATAAVVLYMGFGSVDKSNAGVFEDDFVLPYAVRQGSF